MLKYLPSMHKAQSLRLNIENKKRKNKEGRKEKRKGEKREKSITEDLNKLKDIHGSQTRKNLILLRRNIKLICRTKASSGPSQLFCVN